MPYHGLDQLLELQNDYVFDWKDWVDLSSIYQNSDYKNIEPLKEQLYQHLQSHVRQNMGISPRSYNDTSFSLSSLLKRAPRPPDYDPFKEFKPQTCNWDMYFAASSRQRKAQSERMFRHCDHGNLLAFHVPSPAQIIILTPDVLKEKNATAIPSSPETETTSGNTLKQFSRRGILDSLIPSSEEESEATADVQIFPGKLDQQPIYQELVRVSDKYKDVKPFDASLLESLSDITHLVNIQNSGEYGLPTPYNGSNPEDLKSRQLPTSLADLPTDAFPIHIPINPLTRYKLNENRLQNLTEEEEKLASLGNLGNTPDKYVGYAQSKFPETLSMNPENMDLLQLYDPTDEELIRRVHAAIHEEGLLKPLYKDLYTKINDSDDSINRMFLSKKDSEAFADYSPQDWTIRPFPGLAEYDEESTAKENKQNNMIELSTGTPQAEHQFDSLKVHGNLNTEDMYHALFLSRYQSRASRLNKYFHEYDRGENADHVDYRFYRTGIFPAERTIILHHLFRAWSKFSQEEGIVSWIAHGALLGWYWNGLHMAWDTDIDIQMSAAEMDRIARKYNNTLVVDFSEEYDDDKNSGIIKTGPDGKRRKRLTSGRYLLEISNRYVDRGKGNGENLIDARFIDITSGAYIDITALAQSGFNETMYGCKNLHFYTMDEIYPLRQTLYEGSPTYVPNNVVGVLRKEYKDFDETAAKIPYLFNRRLNVWTTKFECRRNLGAIESVDNKFWNSTRVEFLRELLIGRTEDGKVGGYVGELIEDLQQMNSKAGKVVAEEASKMKTFDKDEEYNEITNYCTDNDVRMYWTESWKLTTLHQLEMAYLEQVLDGDRDFTKARKVKPKPEKKEESKRQVQLGKTNVPTPPPPVEFPDRISNYHYQEDEYLKSFEDMTTEEIAMLKKMTLRQPALYPRLQW